MKRGIALLLAAVLCLGLCACGNEKEAVESTDLSTTAVDKVVAQDTEQEEQTETERSTEKDAAEQEAETKPEVSAKAEMGMAEFEALLGELPVVVKSTKYVVQDEQHKALYPDMLQAVIQNNTEADIKNAVVAFVAWDKNGLPVKIKGSIDFSDGAYIKQVAYNDINLVPGATFGESSGFSVDADCGIETFCAIVVSFETFEGDSWENPYFAEWCTLYEGVKYREDLSVAVEQKDVGFAVTPQSAAEDASETVSEEALLELLEMQVIRVISTKYVVQDAQYKALYPDMLQAVIKNDTEFDIKNAVVAFAAWDKNGLPVKIKGSIDFSDGAYIKQVAYNDINLVPGATFGESSGFSVDADCGIETFCAIVVSYETFEGDSWENPLYDAWCELYEGVKRS